MPSPFADTFLPALAGEVGKLPTAGIQGQLQGMEMARNLALLDMQLKAQQMQNLKAERDMQQPQTPAFHNLGAGAFAIVDPKTGQPTRIERPPQALSPDAQMLGLMATPQGRQLLQDYYGAKRGPQGPTIVPPGSTVLPAGSPELQSQPSQPTQGFQPTSVPQPQQPYTAPMKPTGSPSDQVLQKAMQHGVQSLNAVERGIYDMAMEKNKPKPSGGQGALDTAFAKDYADWVAGGGYADVEKQLGQLRGASQALATDTSLTGPFVGMMPDRMRNITNPQAMAVRDQVLEVVQRNLRMILGPQFTEREGAMLMRRAYNEQQPAAENKTRVDRLITQIEAAAKAKANAAQYFEQHGTLQGWKGKLPSLSDFNPDVAGIGEGRKPVTPQSTQKFGSPRMIAPPVGAVVGGYRFKGGNPADKSNWEAAGGRTVGAVPGR